MTRIGKALDAIGTRLRGAGFSVAQWGAPIEPADALMPLAYISAARGQAAYEPAGAGYEMVNWSILVIAVNQASNVALRVSEKLVLADQVLSAIFPDGAELLYYGTELLGSISAPMTVEIENRVDQELIESRRDVLAVAVDFTLNMYARRLTD